MESTQTRKPYGRYIDQDRVTLRELIDTCLRNCANSYRILSLESHSQPIPGQGTILTSLTKPSHETYVSNVLELAVHIPTNWKNDEIREAEKRIEDHWQQAAREGWHMGGFLAARTLHHEIIELLIERRDLEAVKIPRTLVD